MTRVAVAAPLCYPYRVARANPAGLVMWEENLRAPLERGPTLKPRFVLIEHPSHEKLNSALQSLYERCTWRLASLPKKLQKAARLAPSYGKGFVRSSIGLAVLLGSTALAACVARTTQEVPAGHSGVEVPRQAGATPTLEYLRTELYSYGQDDDPYYKFRDIILFSNSTSVAWEFRGVDVSWPSWVRAIPTGNGVWKVQSTATSIPLSGSCVIEPGQIALFPAYSTRRSFDLNSGWHSRLQLKLTNAESGDVVLIFTEGYTPKITAEDEAVARQLDWRGKLR